MKNIASVEYKPMPQYVLLLSMLYVAAFTFPLFMAYRPVQLWFLLLPAGTVFFASSYPITDLASEVYGYQVARQIIWNGMAVQMLLALMILLMNILPAPTNWKHAAAYQYVTGHAMRYALASTVGNFIGEFINIFAASKIKIIWEGKRFWLRSFISTFVGEAILTVIVFLITFLGNTPHAEIKKLILSAYGYKLLFAAIACYPIQMLAHWMKKKESTDIYDLSTKFNPFKYDISDPMHNLFKEKK